MRPTCPHCLAPLNPVAGTTAGWRCESCSGAPESVAPASGETADGRTPAPLPMVTGGQRFDLLDRLGSGSYGAVWRARDRRLDRDVAIKLLHPGLVDAPAARERFRREARTVAQLRHPGIAAVHEITEIAGQPAMVADLVRGITLREYALDRHLDERACARLTRQAAEALDYAHSLGVVHRDVKPANLLVEAPADAVEPRVIIVDFGLALVEEAGATLTQAGQLIGTPAYMSPEQAGGRPEAVDRRTDVYALGTVLYELLTGEPPFSGHQSSIIHRILSEEPPAPSRRRAGLARDLESICLKAMAKEPSRRYPTARDLADDLGRFLAGEPVHARSIGRGERVRRWCRRNPLAACLGATTATLLLAVALVSLTSVVRLRHERAATLENLRSSYLNEARARLGTSLPGRRFESLRLLRQAAAIRGGPDLRAAAAAVLPLVDLEAERAWALRPPDGDQCQGVGFAADLKSSAIRNEGDSTIVVLALPDSTVVRRFAWDPRQPCQLKFSPDGRFLLAHGGRGDTFHLWDVADGRELLGGRSLAWEGFGVFAADGSRVTLCLQDGAFVVLALPSGRELGRLRCGGTPGTYAVSRDGRRLAVSCDEDGGTLRLLDLETGAPAAAPQRRPGAVTDWSPDGRRLALTRGALVDLLDLASGESTTLAGHQHQVMCAQWNPGGNVIATRGWDGATRLWNPQTGRELLHVTGHFVRWSGDGERLAYAFREKVGWWRVADGRECRTLVWRHRPEEGPNALDLAPDGGRFVTCHDDGARVWDTVSGQEIAFAPAGQLTGAAFGPTGERLYTLGERGLLAWNVVPARAGFPVGPAPSLATAWFPPGRGTLDSAAVVCPRATRQGAHLPWSPDVRWAVIPVPKEQRVLAIDLASGDSLSFGPNPRTNRAAIGIEGSWVASTAQFGDTIKVWDRRTGEARLVLPSTLGGGAAFSADGRWLVTSANGEAPRLWELPAFRAEEPPLPRAAAYFTGEAGLFVLHEEQGTLRLLDTASRRERLRLVAPEAYGLSGLDGDTAGHWLVTATAAANVVQIWDRRRLESELRELGFDDAVAPGAR